jgi:hypothetical protein
MLDKLAKKISYLYYVMIIMFAIKYFVFKQIDNFIIFSMFTLLYFVLRSAKFPFVTILIYVIFSFWAHERGVMLVSIFSYFIYRLPFYKHKKLLNALFLLLVACMLVYPFVFISLFLTDIGNKINLFVFNITEQSFFSGRQVVWGVIIANIIKQWIIGFGLGNNILATNGITMSTHNLYLHLMLQGGIISVVFFILFLFSLFKNYYTQNTKTLRWAIAYFFGILLLTGNWVFMITNALAPSIFLWMAVSFGIIESRSYKVKNKQQAKQTGSKQKAK